MRDFFKTFRKSESGATLVEYGIALILAIIVGGAALVNLAGDVNQNLDGACEVTAGVAQIGDLSGADAAAC